MSSVPVPADLLHALRDGQRFVLTGHRRPDGDSLGSALGLARVLPGGRPLSLFYSHGRL